MGTTKTKKQIKGSIYTTGDLTTKTGYLPSSLRDVTDKEYVDNAIAGAAVVYLSQDGIYDNNI